MKVARLDDMIRGWFVGDFAPTVFATSACEVGIKQYKQGDKEECHYHRIATEITTVISGEIKMCDQIFHMGDIVVLSPNDETAFEALTDATIVVVKVPGAKNDKYISVT